MHTTPDKKQAASQISLRDYIVDVPDFPKPPTVFRDISPLLRNYFSQTIKQMAGLLSDEQWHTIDLIGGIEARGFILAAGLAAIKHKGFVKIRKQGKLPGKVIKRNYSLEYGEDALEMQPGTGKMLIVDDVLATGGTLVTAAELAKECGYDVRGFLCLINLKYLNKFSWNGLSSHTLIDYE